MSEDDTQLYEWPDDKVIARIRQIKTLGELMDFARANRVAIGGMQNPRRIIDAMKQRGKEIKDSLDS